MSGKGHCRFDTSEEGSEFAEFYDFSEPEDVAGSESESDGEGDESSQEEIAASPSRKPQPVDQDSIRLPSGRIISRQSSAQVAPSFTQLRRRTRAYASRLEYSLVDPKEDEGSSREEPGLDVPETRVLSKREKREKEIVTNRLTSMSANDRNSLIHLPASQQRSLIAAQLRHAGKVQKEERRRQDKIDRKGNKNLYAYWHTETPVYQCG
ncbi:Cytoplasmic 60S subunit biogenesis factor [Diaporthe amygdali]|uniref:Cytoplasmic 60S subunit biogenesis factor n=1 Tax=Phomopsis amygdali TaxID=1214568 RepID=UPI0022FDD526|nr:Cytoplasmic 60S subunit biogenesis factor [Diaporthe amygdali]KAJ0124914.1 Cytoplasmic 60S subunit biogenesis factor [Diaporthe amygdali]